MIQNKGFKNLKFNSKQFWGSIAEGTVTGTFAGLTFGGSLAATAGGTIAKQTVKSALKSTFKHAAIGMGAGFLGNAANQTISKGVGNYDMIEGITSSVAGAASFMTAGMLLPAASTGNQAVAKAAASLGKRALSAGATGFKIGASTGLAADVSVQTAKILGGEQKRFDPFSTGLSTLAGGAVGAGIAAGAEVLANSNATGMIKNTLSKLKGSMDEGNTQISLKQALKQLDASGLRPGQTELHMSQLYKVITKIKNQYNPAKAYSSVYFDGIQRYLVEGHHTTVAFKMLGKENAVNMNTTTKDTPAVTNVYWARKWYQLWRKTIKIVED